VTDSRGASAAADGGDGEPHLADPEWGPMVEALLPEVMQIENAVYAYPWTEGIFRDCLRAGYCCRVMCVAGRVVAYAVMSVAAGESHLLNLCVAPAHRRHGLARAMVGLLLDQAERQRAQMVFLEVRPSNQAALALYQDIGFAEVGLRANYYPAVTGREDAMVMARALVGEPMFSD